ncbi:MAG: PP2C family protein-serine/threonine phosphatase [Bdellovibrionales bacterium]
MRPPKSDVAVKMIEEAFSRGATPAMAYFAMGILIYFYKFNSVRFAEQMQWLALAMCLVCVVRVIVAVAGARRKSSQSMLLPMLQTTIVLHGFIWGWIFFLVFFESPLGSTQSQAAIAILAGISATVPTSLIAFPYIQMFFFIVTTLVSTLTYLYRWLQPDSPQDTWIPVVLLSIFLSYLVGLSRKLRANLILIYEQQQRIKQDLQAAKDIQRSLLPATSHTFGNTKLEILYKPCEELSGDFFEVYQDKNHLLFYVADVTSHGTASAQVTYLLKGIFKNILARLGDNIEIVAIAERMAQDYIAYDLNYAVSLFVAHYDIKSGALNYVSSNFPSPVLVSDGAMDVMAPLMNPVIDSRMFDKEEPFAKATAEVKPGDAFYMFTDGSYEFKSDEQGHEFGLKRFLKLLVQSPAQNWADSFYQKLRETNEHAIFDDDITVLKLSRRT